MNEPSTPSDREAAIAHILRAIDGRLAPAWWEPPKEREVTRARLLCLIDELLDLRDSTRPELGAASEVDKFDKAIEAKTLLNQIAQLAAGWAFDHLVGTALRGLDDAAADAPDELAEESWLVLATAELNSHDNETISREWDGNLTPKQARDALRRISGVGIENRPGAQHLANQFLSALIGLGHGQRAAILEPQARPGQRTNYEVCRLKLFALRYIEYHRGRGDDVLALRAEVAVAFGLPNASTTGAKSIEHDWPEELRSFLGRAVVDIELGLARTHAAILRNADKDLPSPETLALRYDDALAHHCSMTYSISRLQQAGAKLLALKRAAQKY